MIPLVLIFALTNGAILAASTWIGIQLYDAGHVMWAGVYAVVLGMVAIQKLGQLIHNLTDEYGYRKKHYSDVPQYVWWSTASDLYGSARPGEIRRRYR